MVIDLRRIKAQFHQDKILADLNRSRGTKLNKLSSNEKSEIRDFYKQYGLNIGLSYHRLYYSVTGNHDPRFLPDWIMYAGLIGKLNDRRMMVAWADKAFVDLHLPGVQCAHTLVRNVNGILYDNRFNLVNADEANKIIASEERIIVKPSIETGGGVGVSMLPSPQNYEELSEKYKKNFIVQRVVEQNDTIAVFNSSSVNTIRIISVNWHGQVHICGQMLRIGEAGAATDNVSHGKGISVGIDDNGLVSSICYRGDGTAFSTTDTFHVPRLFNVAGVPKARLMIEEAHRHLPYFGIVAWDIAIDKNGEPVLLEFNVRAIGIKNFQYNNGPIFGELTGEILDYIRK